MYSGRGLQIVISITAVLISINGLAPGLNRLGNVDRLKERELDYGERLSSMNEDDTHDGLREELDRKGGTQLLKGKLDGKTNGTLHLEKIDQTQSTKCTTNEPVKVDLNAEKQNSDETTGSSEGLTITTIPSNSNESGESGEQVTQQSDDVTTNGDDVTTNGGDVTTTTPDESGENKVGPAIDDKQDPSKDEQDDITISTKTYFGPLISYAPDHYLDDA